MLSLGRGHGWLVESKPQGGDGGMRRARFDGPQAGAERVYRRREGGAASPGGRLLGGP